MPIQLIELEEMAKTGTAKRKRKAEAPIPSKPEKPPTLSAKADRMVPPSTYVRITPLGKLTTLVDTCCDKVCKYLNREIDYREIISSTEKKYIKRYPVPRATEKLAKGGDHHPAPTVREFLYPSPTYDVEALDGLRDSLDNTCKCSSLKPPSEEEITKMMNGPVVGLTTLSPSIVRQIYKRDVPIPNVLLASAQNKNSGCCVDVCKKINLQISKLERQLNEAELTFKSDPKLRAQSPTYVSNVYKSHMLKEYRNNLKRKQMCDCIE